MSALLLKIFAVLFMLIDHIGLAIGPSGFDAMGFSDGYILLRAIGRLSMPIFAFLIANGFKYTRSVPKYALRLFVFALISEVPFDLFVSGEVTWFTPRGIIPHLILDNIFFTLLLGLGFLVVNSYAKKKLGKIAPLVSAAALVAFCIASGFISADYGVVGVMWVALFGLIDIEDKKNIPILFMGCVVLSYWKIIARCVLVGVYRLTAINIASIKGLGYFFSGSVDTMALVQSFALVSFAFLLLYNGKSGAPKNKVLSTVLKYGFYAFYPLHMLVLYFIFR